MAAFTRLVRTDSTRLCRAPVARARSSAARSGVVLSVLARSARDEHGPAQQDDSGRQGRTADLINPPPSRMIRGRTAPGIVYTADRLRSDQRLICLTSTCRWPACAGLVLQLSQVLQQQGWGRTYRPMALRDRRRRPPRWSSG